MGRPSKLHVTRGALQGNEYVFEGSAQCAIGRAHDCHIRLPVDDSQRDVSRRHCLLIIEPPSVRIRDLGSLNGTFVNGRNIGQRLPEQAPGNSDPGPAADHMLQDGDEIQLGHNVLHVEVMADAATAAETELSAHAVGK
ncbi:MAG: FHA domain-containing protein [Gemmataceae bacterium]|nr:FHA domain-containing protein [Gemmataceae bacterium]